MSDSKIPQTTSADVKLEMDPSIMYAVVEDTKYKAEMEVFDRWQSFSAELLRLSLLGIAAFGFFYQQVFATFDPIKHLTVPIGSIKTLSQWSVVAFAISTVFALAYRYFCTEAIVHYVRGARSDSIQKSELGMRNRLLAWCYLFKVVSVVSLATGAVLTATGMFRLLKEP